MISNLCKFDEHECCTKVYRLAHGKVFKCSCSCHPIELPKVKVREIEEDEDD